MKLTTPRWHATNVHDPNISSNNTSSFTFRVFSITRVGVSVFWTAWTGKEYVRSAGPRDEVSQCG